MVVQARVCARTAKPVQRRRRADRGQGASGTQLIQELIADGFHRVTRYKPECDKIMRLHAQTAIIENGFVHLPDAAALARRISPRDDGLPERQAR